MPAPSMSALRTGGCGRLNHTQHFMEGAPPAVFTLQLAWESQREDGATIADTLDALEETVDLGAHGLLAGSGSSGILHQSTLEQQVIE